MNIIYNCPYNDWEWASSQVKLSGNYAYPIVLTYPLKSCSAFTIEAFLYADTTVPFNRSWNDVLRYLRQYYKWKPKYIKKAKRQSYTKKFRSYGAFNFKK